MAQHFLGGGGGEEGKPQIALEKGGSVQSKAGE